MGKAIDFYFVTISPWSYLGLSRLVDIARCHDATINYKPVDLPRIFETVGYQPITKRPPALLVNRMNELIRWRDFLDAEINLEPKHFPVDATLSLCTIIAAQQQGHDVGALTLALMRGCWVEERDISDRETVMAIATEQALDGAALVEAADGTNVQQQLSANTDQAIEHAAMGVPTFVVEGESFFGQDRLPFIERKLAGSESAPAYLIGQIHVKDPALWQRYVAGVRNSLQPFCAEVLFRGERNAVLSGDSDRELSVVIRFPDQKTLQNWFSSREYQELIPLRDAAAETTIISYDLVL